MSTYIRDGLTCNAMREVNAIIVDDPIVVNTDLLTAEKVRSFCREDFFVEAQVAM